MRSLFVLCLLVAVGVAASNCDPSAGPGQPAISAYAGGGGSSEKGGGGSAGDEAMFPTPEELVAALDLFDTDEELAQRLGDVQAAFAPFQQDFYQPQTGPRERLLLDGSWKFALDRKGTAFADGENQGWQQPAFNDALWSTRTLPDWAEYSRGWYRKHFTVIDPQDGRRRILALENVDHRVMAWLNGQQLSWNDSDGPAAEQHVGYIRRRIDLDVTDHLVAGDNLLAIQIINFYDTFNLNYLQVSQHDGRDGRDPHGVTFGNGAMLGAVWLDTVGAAHVQTMRPRSSSAPPANAQQLRGLVIRPDRVTPATGLTTPVRRPASTCA